MIDGEGKAQRRTHTSPFVSALGLGLIAIGVSLQFPAATPLDDKSIRTFFHAVVFGALGYWLGARFNLVDAIRHLPRLLKRFVPRFSVRTLAIFVTLLCVYFGMWETTKRSGVPTLESLSNQAGKNPMVLSASSPYPFVVRQSEWIFYDPFANPMFDFRQRYYLWVFGPKIILVDREWDGESD